MKKYIALIIAITLIGAVGCKKKKEGEADKAKEASIVKKYAKYASAVYDDKEMKKWKAYISKAEPVDLLGTEKIENAKKKQIDIAKIKLSDDTVVYLPNDAIADKAVVFTEDTKAMDRNNVGSSVYTTIPKGTVGFIIEEKADWAQVFIGYVEEKYVKDKWVKGGYSTDAALILDGRTFEEINSVLKKEAKEPDKLKPNESEDARKKLKELAKSATIFGELASKKMQDLGMGGPDGGMPGPH